MDPVLAGFLGGLIPASVAALVSWRNSRAAERKVYTHYLTTVQKLMRVDEDARALRQESDEIRIRTDAIHSGLARLRTMPEDDEPEREALADLGHQIEDNWHFLEERERAIERHEGRVDEVTSEWAAANTELALMKLRGIERHRVSVGNAVVALAQLRSVDDPSELEGVRQRLQDALADFERAAIRRSRRMLAG